MKEYNFSVINFFFALSISALVAFGINYLFNSDLFKK
jgi:hypothetical protein